MIVVFIINLETKPTFTFNLVSDLQRAPHAWLIRLWLLQCIMYRHCLFSYDDIGLLHTFLCFRWTFGTLCRLSDCHQSFLLFLDWEKDKDTMAD